jgi:hypothetical protein
LIRIYKDYEMVIKADSQFWEKLDVYKQWIIDNPSVLSGGTPPLYKLLWSMKIKVLPPYYQGKLALFLFQGGFGALMCTFIVIPILVFLLDPSTMLLPVVYSLFGSFLMFGGIALLSGEYKFKRKLIPTWDSFSNDSLK